MKLPLDEIEARLQALIESSLPFLPAADRTKQLAHELVEAMNENLVLTSGKVIAPHIFLLKLPKDQINHWLANPGLMRELTRSIIQAAMESKIHFQHTPVLRLEADDTLLPGEIKVSASRPAVSLGDTAGLPVITEPEEKKPEKSFRAFLIIKGSTVYNISHSVINLGRRVDNQVIIDDPRISRSHAQIRHIRGKYILFDLNSTGGTFVNGERIQQKTLKAGDVISLAGVPIIFGIETNLNDSPSLHDSTSSFNQNEVLSSGDKE
mgnify:CR=1 FL=1